MSATCGRYEAGFVLDDPDVVVGAALSCPACLSGGTALEIGCEDQRLAGRGTCRACGSAWALALSPPQLLRLSLDPPSGADVRWRPDLPHVVFGAGGEGEGERLD